MAPWPDWCPALRHNSCPGGIPTPDGVHRGVNGGVKVCVPAVSKPVFRLWPLSRLVSQRCPNRCSVPRKYYCKRMIVKLFEGMCSAQKLPAAAFRCKVCGCACDGGWACIDHCLTHRHHRSIVAPLLRLPIMRNGGRRGTRRLIACSVEHVASGLGFGSHPCWAKIAATSRPRATVVRPTPRFRRPLRGKHVWAAPMNAPPVNLA